MRHCSLYVIGNEGGIQKVKTRKGRSRKGSVGAFVGNGSGREIEKVKA